MTMKTFNAKTQRRKDAKKGMDENPLSRVIIGAAIEVHRALGRGLPESIYEDALCMELGRSDIPLERQVDFPVRYKGVELKGRLRLDIIIDSRIIVEVKAVDRLVPVHEAQLLSHLRATDKRLGLLINFNATVLRDSIRRVVNAL